MNAPDQHAELRRLGTRRRKLMDELGVLDQDIRPLIADALRDGVRQSDVMTWTGHESRDTLRRIAREYGIESRRGRRPRS